MGERREKLKGARKYIAEAMRKSTTLYPAARYFVDLDMSELLELSERYAREGCKISTSALMAKLFAAAIKDFPALNSRMEGDEILYYDEINCGFGVDLGTGLLVVVVRDLANKSLPQISDEFRAMIGKIKNKTLTVDDTRDGTFTLTSIDNVRAFTSIITNDQCLIISCAGIRREVIVGENDELLIRPIRTVTVTFNHAIVDGKGVHDMLERMYEIARSPQQYF